MNNHSHSDIEEPGKLPQLQRRKRLAWGAIVAVLVHILLYLLAPRIYLPQAPTQPTEVVQITESDLKKLKEQILKRNRFLPPVLKQEQHERFKTKEPPPDAKFMGQFNQKVPEETVAGAQQDEPLDGGGSQTKRRPPAAPKQDLKLSDIGLKNKIPKPLPPEPQGQQSDSQNNTGRGPGQGRGPFRPVGRDDKQLKRGDQNLLNTVESEYYSFFARFEEPIIRNWYFLSRLNRSQIVSELSARRTPVGAELPATVQFTIDRRGRFLRIEIVSSSGIPTFDAATRQAVAKLGSLPNPPEGIFEGQPTFTYHMTFTLVVTSGLSVGTPSVNWY